MASTTKRNSSELLQKIAEVKKELRALHRDKKRLEREMIADALREGKDNGRKDNSHPSSGGNGTMDASKAESESVREV